MLLGIALLAAAAGTSAATPSELAPANVPDVVAGAVTCFDAVAKKDVQLSRLTGAGWVELLDANGKPETAGGHAFRREGVSAEIAVFDGVCSIVAPVKSFDDVQATLLKLDDAIHPDHFEEVKQGIVLTKGRKSILFWVGDSTVKTPAAVRIDTTFSETK